MIVDCNLKDKFQESFYGVFRTFFTVSSRKLFSLSKQQISCPNEKFPLRIEFDQFSHHD